MSRIGKKPVAIPSGVTAKVEGAVLTMKGPKGELRLTVHPLIKAVVETGNVVLTPAGESRAVGSLHGLTRSLVANMVTGVTRGYSKDLEIQGVGFKAAVQGKKLSLLLGYSKPVDYPIPDGITITVTDGTNLTIAGPDKQKVGDVAARIISYFPAEPYKGKGVRYKGEHVRRKVGKTVA